MSFGTPLIGCDPDFPRKITLKPKILGKITNSKQALQLSNKTTKNPTFFEIKSAITHGRSSYPDTGWKCSQWTIGMIHLQRFINKDINYHHLLGQIQNGSFRKKKNIHLTDRERITISRKRMKNILSFFKFSKTKSKRKLRHKIQALGQNGTMAIYN